MSLRDALLHDQANRLMTQEEYAAHLGVSLSALQFWLAGRAPSAKMARKLVDKGVNPSAVKAAVASRARRAAA